jgi:uncharacterized protein (DUF1501 family)
MAALPAVIQLAEAVAAAVEEKKEEKRVIICVTRDIAEDDLSLLKGYGKVLFYNHSLHNNLSCDRFEWEYLILDLRDSDSRYYIMKYVLPHKDEYSIAVYHFPFEDQEDLLDADSYFTSFPKEQATKQSFNELMMMQRIKRPRAAVSLLKCCLALYNKTK